MLYEASHSREEGVALAHVRATPPLAVYVEGFGRHGDDGIIAMRDGSPVGAAWVRLIRAYGFVAESIPELAIAVCAGHEGAGIGTVMMKALFAECAERFEAISLSVRQDNPAAALYQRLGFEEVLDRRVTNRVGTISCTMVLRF